MMSTTYSLNPAHGKGAPVASFLRAPLVCLTMQGHHSRYGGALTAITNGLQSPGLGNIKPKRPYLMCDGIIRPSSVLISAQSYPCSLAAEFNTQALTVWARSGHRVAKGVDRLCFPEPRI